MRFDEAPGSSANPQNGEVASCDSGALVKSLVGICIPQARCIFTYTTGPWIWGKCRDSYSSTMEHLGYDPDGYSLCSEKARCRSEWMQQICCISQGLRKLRSSCTDQITLRFHQTWQWKMDHLQVMFLLKLKPPLSSGIFLPAMFDDTGG